MRPTKSYRTRKLLQATAGLATITYFGAAGCSCTSGNLMAGDYDYDSGGTSSGGSSSGGSPNVSGGAPAVTGGDTGAGGLGLGGCDGGAAGEGGQGGEGGSSCGAAS